MIRSPGPSGRPRRRRAAAFRGALVAGAVLLAEAAVAVPAAAQCATARLREWPRDRLESARRNANRLINAIDNDDVFFFDPAGVPRVYVSTSGARLPTPADGEDFARHITAVILGRMGQGNMTDEELDRQYNSFLNRARQQSREVRADLRRFVDCLSTVLDEGYGGPFDPLDNQSVENFLIGTWVLEIEFTPGLPMSSAQGTLQVDEAECRGAPDVSCTFRGWVDTGDGMSQRAFWVTTGQATTTGGEYSVRALQFETYGQFYDGDELLPGWGGTYRFHGVISAQTGRVELGSVTYTTPASVFEGGTWRAYHSFGVRQR